MELYIGGMDQGKKAYVLQERGIAKEEIWDDFEVWVREELQGKKPAEEDAQAILAGRPEIAIICDEVGNGIVPMDAFEREYRERLGRFLIEVAKRADRVERIMCGIGQRIK